MSLYPKTRLFAFGLSAAVFTACGGSGGSPASLQTQDTAAPRLSFETESLIVASGETETSIFTATDNVGFATGPSISCTEGGAHTGTAFTAPVVTVDTISICTATATDTSGNSGEAILTVRITAPNQAPTAQATANKSIISEGQPFTLDASDSSDPEDTALEYSWSQIEGPAVDFSNTSEAVLELDAPLSDTDTTLVFEVTVTDGEVASTQTVSIDVEALDTLTLAGWAPPNTGGIFTSQIAGITAPAEGGFRTHWGTPTLSSRSWTASQLFNDSLERVGPESRITINQGEPVFSGRLTRAVQSGEQTYYIHETSSFSSEEDVIRRGFSVLSERPESDREGFGALIAEGRASGFDPSFPFRIEASAYSEDSLVTVLKSSGPGAASHIDGFIHAPDGSQIQTPILEPTTDNVGEIAVSQAGETAYLATWTQGTADPIISSVIGRRITNDGTQSENVITIGDPLGLSYFPAMTTLSDGRILVIWNEIETTIDPQSRSIMGRILSVDGAFETDIFTLYTTAESGENLGTLKITPMQNGQALIAWWSLLSEEIDGSVQSQEVRIRALAVGASGAPVSNVFDLYTERRNDGEDVLLEIDEFQIAVSTDNRALVGWNFRTGGPDENSFYSDFYPVGR